jgi:uncharacterized protein
MANIMTQKYIKELCKQIVENFHPEKIILFGSYAYGKPNQYSDLDLLVIMPFNGSPLSQAAKIITQIKPKTALDLIIRTPEQIQERLAMKDNFMKDIIENGKVTYTVKGCKQ